jgi:hypothetical protein
VGGHLARPDDSGPPALRAPVHSVPDAPDTMWLKANPMFVARFNDAFGRVRLYTSDPD